MIQNFRIFRAKFSLTSDTKPNYFRVYRVLDLDLVLMDLTNYGLNYIFYCKIRCLTRLF